MTTTDAMLPPPTLSFTIPSLHDGTTLDCRVFHAASLSPSPRAPPWRRHAAVVAHPYGPMGGSYDDPIVAVVAATLLRLGFLVVTFNFRCACLLPAVPASMCLLVPRSAGRQRG